jgi:hypothetical protein
MKNINKIFSLAFVAILTTVTFTSCEYDEDKARFPQLTNGGFVKFVSAPEFDMGADPATASFSAMTEDPNGNVASYEVTVVGDFTGAPSEALPFGSTTTFPYDVSFTTADMAELFGVDASVFVEDDSFEFFGVVTTEDGSVYDGTAPGGTTSGQVMQSLLRTDLYSGGGATTNTYNVGNNLLDGDYDIFSAAEGEVVDADTQLVISGAGMLASGELIAQTTLTSIGSVAQTKEIPTDTDGAGSGVLLSITGDGTSLVSVIPVANGDGYPFGYASGDTITITESNLQAQGFEDAVGDLVVTLIAGDIVSSIEARGLRLTVLDGTITEAFTIGDWGGPGNVLTAGTSALDATVSNSGTGTGTLVIEITAAHTDAGTWNGGQTNGVLTSAAGLLNAFNWEVSYEDAN